MMAAAKPSANAIGTSTPPICAEPEQTPPPAVMSTQFAICDATTLWAWMTSTVNTGPASSKPPTSPTSAWPARIIRTADY